MRQTKANSNSSRNLYMPLSQNEQDPFHNSSEEDPDEVYLDSAPLVGANNQSAFREHTYESSNETVQNDVWFSQQKADEEEEKSTFVRDGTLCINEDALRSLLSVSSTDGLVKRSGMTKRNKKRLQQRPVSCGYGSCDSSSSNNEFLVDPAPSSTLSREYRYTFFSPSLPSAIHTQNLINLGPTIHENIAKNNGECFWIDIKNPTESEMKQLQNIFYIHPLTAEDITTEEPREKCEAFNHYYFICFKSFDNDPYSPSYLHPIGLYILIFRGFVLTFHFGSLPHAANVRKRMLHLKGSLDVKPDWICYGLLDDITDVFAPLVRAIEFEVDSIDELVLILKESEQSDMLRRIGYCRKKMMSLLRLLVAKSDVIKTLIKRGEESYDTGRFGGEENGSKNNTRPNISKDIIIYLGDIQDHIVAMLQSLNHYEKISSRSHSNYLAQISIEMTQTNNEINDVLSKLTALGSVLVPMNLVTGLWGMNVQVPGQFQQDLSWFFSIMFSILTFCILSALIMRSYKII